MTETESTQRGPESSTGEFVLKGPGETAVPHQSVTHWGATLGHADSEHPFLPLANVPPTPAAAVRGPRGRLHLSALPSDALFPDDSRLKTSFQVPQRLMCFSAEATGFIVTANVAAHMGATLPSPLQSVLVKAGQAAVTPCLGPRSAPRSNLLFAFPPSP